MKGELKTALVHYYDFLTAYENLLREDGEWYGVDITSEDNQCTFNQWPPQKQQIATVGKRFANKDVIHLLSYRNATHLDWCDTEGNQGEPDLLENLAISFNVKAEPKAVWIATPDYQDCVAIHLDYQYENGKINCTIPSLKYWSMIVVEY